MISIVIPVLNEGSTITSLLRHLELNATGKVLEVLVVDGGSTDDTAEKVQIFATQTTEIPVQLIPSYKKGRAVQMNLGAQYAQGPFLYFLHADSFPPKDFDALILDEIEKGQRAGCFRMRFDHSHWWLKLAGWLTRFKSKACRGGDQSQFIDKELFEEIGGFDESYTVYEDYVLINELYRRKEFVVIPAWLTTSARRYEQTGLWRLQYHFWAIYLKKFMGANADELYRYYKKNIAS